MTPERLDSLTHRPDDESCACRACRLVTGLPSITQQMFYRLRWLRIRPT